MLKFVGRFMDRGPAVVLDAPSGYGRNAIAMAAHGISVVCLDNDYPRLLDIENTKSERLKAAPISSRRGNITSICFDLKNNNFPFRGNTFNAIVCVHYDPRLIISTFQELLVPGGFCYIESFGGQGNNYRMLPQAGEMRAALVAFDIVYYEERKVGPVCDGSVAYKVLAQRRN